MIRTLREQHVVIEAAHESELASILAQLAIESQWSLKNWPL